MSEVLRQYIKATLDELRVDPKMLKLLRGTGLRATGDEVSSGKEAQALADEWLQDMGERSGHHKVRVHRYTARKWPQLLKRFRGDKEAARQTLYNLLDTKLSEGDD